MKPLRFSIAFALAERMPDAQNTTTARSLSSSPIRLAREETGMFLAFGSVPLRITLAPNIEQEGALRNLGAGVRPRDPRTGGEHLDERP